jgi:L-rhamnose mutarotase
MDKKKVTQKRLKEVLEYSPESGLFTWIKPYNSRFMGKVAGHTQSGYVYISVDNLTYLASRLAYLYMLGYFPENDIDHKNRIRNDNRWENLREVTKTCNNRNMGMFLNNKSGIKGVFWRENISKWIAHIKVKSKGIQIGTSPCIIEAACLRLAAEQAEGWPNCDTSSSALKVVTSYVNREKPSSNNRGSCDER